MELVKEETNRPMGQNREPKMYPQKLVSLSLTKKLRQRENLTPIHDKNLMEKG